MKMVKMDWLQSGGRMRNRRLFRALSVLCSTAALCTVVWGAACTFCISKSLSAPEHPGYTCSNVPVCAPTYDSLMCLFCSESEAYTCTRPGYPAVTEYFNPCGTGDGCGSARFVNCE